MVCFCFMCLNGRETHRKQFSVVCLSVRPFHLPVTLSYKDIMIGYQHMRFFENSYCSHILILNWFVGYLNIRNLDRVFCMFEWQSEYWIIWQLGQSIVSIDFAALVTAMETIRDSCSGTPYVSKENIDLHSWYFSLIYKKINNMGNMWKICFVWCFTPL